MIWQVVGDRGKVGTVDQCACLANPVLHFEELVWGENGGAKLGEELLNPQMESLLLDPKIKAIVNHDSDNGDAGFLALDGFFFSLSIGEADGVVKKQEVGGISSAFSVNQIVHQFLVKLSPFDMCMLDDTVDLGQRESFLFTQGFGFGMG